MSVHATNETILFDNSISQQAWKYITETKGGSLSSYQRETQECLCFKIFLESFIRGKRFLSNIPQLDKGERDPLLSTIYRTPIVERKIIEDKSDVDFDALVQAFRQSFLIDRSKWTRFLEFQLASLVDTAASDDLSSNLKRKFVFQHYTSRIVNWRSDLSSANDILAGCIHLDSDYSLRLGRIRNKAIAIQRIAGIGSNEFLASFPSEAEFCSKAVQFAFSWFLRGASYRNRALVNNTYNDQHVVISTMTAMHSLRSAAVSSSDESTYLLPQKFFINTCDIFQVLIRQGEFRKNNSFDHIYFLTVLECFRSEYNRNKDAIADACFSAEICGGQKKNQEIINLVDSMLTDCGVKSVPNKKLARILHGGTVAGIGIATGALKHQGLRDILSKAGYWSDDLEMIVASSEQIGASIAVASFAAFLGLRFSPIKSQALLKNFVGIGPYFSYFTHDRSKVGNFPVSELKALNQEEKNAE